MVESTNRLCHNTAARPWFDIGILSSDAGEVDDQAGGDGIASYPSLRGRVAFVSGGASGLGAEFVRQLAGQGAKVAFIDIDVERGRELEAELRDAVLFVPCDVRDVGALRAAIARSAGELGPIRILVNNAADDRRYPVEEVDVALWDDLTAVNVRHHFFAAQAVAPMMREAGGGSIINVGSISAHIDLLGLPAYTRRRPVSKDSPTPWRASSGLGTSGSTASSPAGS